MTIGTKEAMAGGVQDSIDQVTFEIDLLTSFQSISAFEIWIVDNWHVFKKIVKRRNSYWLNHFVSSFHQE